MPSTTTGARASVLSQWKVDSGATSDLMIDFHRRLTAGKGVDKPNALRQGCTRYHALPRCLHPFYWAAFLVVGDTRERLPYRCAQ
jgi:CHAT domain-containing protein